MQPHVITNPEQKAEASAEAHINPVHLQGTLISNPVKSLFSQNERVGFYNGGDRLTLQNHNITRVRELQEMNDNLQRDIVKKEKHMLNSSDPLSILADIEHAKILIARNTGEIINIHVQDEERRKRIAELEEQNVKLRMEMIAMQGKFITNHEQDLRIKHAADFFTFKTKLEQNLAEIVELSQN